MLDDKLPDWLTSDNHWNHSRINQFCARTTPAFPTQESVEQLMRFNWQGLVKPGDKVLHLGDLGFFEKDSEVEWLKDLHGEVEIVLGNHDSRTKPSWLAKHGFKVIDPPTYTVDGVQVFCDHYPHPDLPPNSISIHGHQHQNPHFSTPAHLNVSVELWSFAPIPFEWAAKKAIWHMRNQDHGTRDRKRRRD